jgi:hypothetical protein
MSISENLHRRLHEVLGSHAAGDLVTMLESMDASRGDVRELRHEMQLGFAQQNAAFEKALREQTRFFFVAWAVILAAIVGIYAK